MRRRACTLLATALLVPGTLAGTLAGAGPAQAADAGLFHPYTTFNPAPWAESVATGDVTGDGRADVVLTTGPASTAGAYSLWIYRQRADGGLDPVPAQIRTGTSSGSMAVTLADLDGDDRLDVAVATAAGVLVYEQGPDGLGSPVTVDVPGGRDLEVADVSGDGVLDLVVNTDRGVRVWKQTPGGPASGVLGTLTSTPATEVETGDVTGDGRVDVVTAEGGTVSVFAQDPGGFAAPATYASGGVAPWTGINGLAVGDTNGDGRADVHVSVGGNLPNSWVVTRLQQGDGTLGAAQARGSYDVPESLEYADVTGDGLGDLVVAHGGWNSLGVYDSAQAPGTNPETRFAIPYASHYGADGLAVGDVTGDGRADVALADYNNGLVLLRGAAPGEDITSPDTSITAAPASSLYARTATLSFTGSEAGSTFECSLDKGAWAACASPMTYGDLAVGPHYVQVRATDPAGNPDQSPATASFSVVAPETAITSGPTGAIRATSATFTFSANENQATYQCAFDGTAFTACTSPVTYANLAPAGSHTFSVRAVAADGRTDSTPATRSFSVDPVVDVGIAATAAPDPVKKGGTLTWTTQVRNPAAISATGVRLTQSVPAGVTVTSATTSDSRAACTWATGSVGCDVAELAAGTTWTVTVRGTVAATKGTLAATATVTTTSWDPNAANDSAGTSVRVGNGR
jgi:uncharacterized repeat protein (TIGR01451 family)